MRTALPAIVPGKPPEYTRFLPTGWREDPATKQATDARINALEQTGAQIFVERLRLEWTTGAPLPEPGDRLAFPPVEDPEELIQLMALVLDGTLDAHSRDALTRMSAREAAESQFRDEFEHYTSPRRWWRIATLPGGAPVGFVVPAHNGYNPVIAYLGVVPAHRGHGYADDILAAGTRLLAAEPGVTRIRASTDVGNAPMAASFARAGYRTFERQLDMAWR